ncbi:hypothetical protein BLNAU_1489 [Blattamonas nauphoetae]|uniref:Uncharacterized protein n=1 Tax=Blattamonas nauphoetae TaxID=2049346 RepID=A0ABQ9YI82_9EUKA|nr:hypothetical protein BLNAU_1489 [Blattamonas nauphoetae]
MEEGTVQTREYLSLFDCPLQHTAINPITFSLPADPSPPSPSTDSHTMNLSFPGSPFSTQSKPLRVTSSTLFPIALHSIPSCPSSSFSPFSKERRKLVLNDDVGRYMYSGMILTEKGMLELSLLHSFPIEAKHRHPHPSSLFLLTPPPRQLAESQRGTLSRSEQRKLAAEERLRKEQEDQIQRTFHFSSPYSPLPLPPEKQKKHPPPSYPVHLTEFLPLLAPRSPSQPPPAPVQQIDASNPSVFDFYLFVHRVKDRSTDVGVLTPPTRSLFQREGCLDYSFDVFRRLDKAVRFSLDTTSMTVYSHSLTIERLFELAQPLTEHALLYLIHIALVHLRDGSFVTKVFKQLLIKKPSLLTIRVFEEILLGIPFRVVEELEGKQWMSVTELQNIQGSTLNPVRKTIFVDDIDEDEESDSSSEDSADKFRESLGLSSAGLSLSVSVPPSSPTPPNEDLGWGSCQRRWRGLTMMNSEDTDDPYLEDPFSTFIQNTFYADQHGTRFRPPEDIATSIHTLAIQLKKNKKRTHLVDLDGVEEVDSEDASLESEEESAPQSRSQNDLFNLLQTTQVEWRKTREREHVLPTIQRKRKRRIRSFFRDDSDSSDGGEVVEAADSSWMSGSIAMKRDEKLASAPPAHIIFGGMLKEWKSTDESILSEIKREARPEFCEAQDNAVDLIMFGMKTSNTLLKLASAREVGKQEVSPKVGSGDDPSKQDQDTVSETLASSEDDENDTEMRIDITSNELDEIGLFSTTRVWRKRFDALLNFFTALSLQHISTPQFLFQFSHGSLITLARKSQILALQFLRRSMFFFEGRSSKPKPNFIRLAAFLTATLHSHPSSTPSQILNKTIIQLFNLRLLSAFNPSGTFFASDTVRSAIMENQNSIPVWTRISEDIIHQIAQF